VLVSSGGLGREVTPVLRAAALPGAEFVLPLLLRDWTVNAGIALGGFLERIGLQPGHDVREVARGFASLAQSDAREAFLHTLRGVIDPGGQRVSAMDRIYLAEELPTMIVWGDRDPVIPIGHGRRAHEAIPGSRLVEIPGAGHWPQLDEPDLFCDALDEFVEDTEPFEFDLEWMREQLRSGPPARA
jgi:pimeloyl-ACP methyl ester carboxylesterase